MKFLKLFSSLNNSFFVVFKKKLIFVVPHIMTNNSDQNCNTEKAKLEVQHCWLEKNSNLATLAKSFEIF